jgi:CubicO group peptidase (beta-lactamase class C family)
MAMTISRRLVLQAGAAGASLAAMGRWRVSEASGPPGDGTYADAWPALDRFVEQYMREMNAPGMALVLADRDGVQRVAHYGFSDFESKDPPQEDTLFEVGSISKSFVALALLQLRDEGKLDLDRPLVEYLPWLRVESRFAPVTTHHLLTHTTGLPGAGDVFQADPELRHLAAYAPGEHFHYNNAMYDVLGILAWTLDGRELPELLRERILRPLGMDRSEPAITLDVRERLAKSYSPFLADRPYARQGKLCEAPGLIATGGAGCVAATARDMGAYVSMIADHGRLRGTRLLSDDGFGRFATPHIPAEDFGPGAHYGYGIAVDTLDGNRLLRHTGGMVSFMSAMMVDIDEGIGGFASVNAQQGYRPNPVVRYAIQLMRVGADRSGAGKRSASILSPSGLAYRRSRSRRSSTGRTPASGSARSWASMVVTAATSIPAGRGKVPRHLANGAPTPTSTGAVGWLGTARMCWPVSRLGSSRAPAKLPLTWT